MTDDTPTPAPDSAHSHAHAHAHSHAHAHEHGLIDADLAESREGVRVLMISLVLLGITAIAQAVVVYYTSSVALLADTVHNFGDALTAIPLAIAFVLSRRPPSQRFPHGLGRTEDLAGVMIVVLIGFSGVFALYQSIDRLFNPQEINYLWAGVAAGVVGFIGNEAVAMYRIRQGRKMHSAALIADGKHARVDALLSLSVVLGLLLVAAGIPIADPIVGLVISAIIGRITWNAARDVGLRMLDGIEPETLDDIRSAALAHVPAESLLDVRARWLGHVIHAEITVDAVWALAHPGLDRLVDADVREAVGRVRHVSMAVRSAVAH